MKIILEGSRVTHRQRRSNFKFEPMWIRHIDCERIIEGNWEPDADLLSSIDSCRIGLVNWGKSEFGSVKGQIRDLRSQLAQLREGEISDSSKSMEDELKSKLEEILERENSVAATRQSPVDSRG